MNMHMQRNRRIIVLFPQEMIDTHYVGSLFGTFNEKSGVYNVFDESMVKVLDSALIGSISSAAPTTNGADILLCAYWDNDKICFNDNADVDYEVRPYSLVQNLFSRNSGILESTIMCKKSAIILGCGSVGSLVALELARAGVGNFLLIDNDIVEYHNICRHQCSIMDVGEYKVDALSKRILQINPLANISTEAKIAEQVGKETFNRFCIANDSLIIGCADNRSADVYANGISMAYGIPFLSIGFWERAFAGEIFYHLPNKNMPCYKCALGDGGDFSQRASTNRRFYTNEEDLALVNFEPGISADIAFVTLIGIKLALDILNIGNVAFTPRLLPELTQYTLVCNTNNPHLGGEMAELFSYPLQVTTSLKVNFGENCPPCECQ